ncbi:MAG: thioredoxin-dependent thiol peroxidase [Flavobacteriales bacterium]|nr:thioredoxin-dependent thiol peroxidase [Flavobacteriales bacterium]
MLKKGDKVPEFNVLDDDERAFSEKDLIGAKTILYFYPKDMTPGCTVQGINLSNNLDELQSKGYRVIGVSADSVKRHCNFKAKTGIKFTLLADESLDMIKSFGVWGLKKFMGREYEGIKRTTFLIDEKGVVESVIEKVKTISHTQQILELIEEKNK